MANMGIAKPKLALKDFKAIVAREPGNRDAIEKLKECEKIVKRLQFEKAIEGGPPPSAWEGFNPEALCILQLGFQLMVAIEESYDGCRLTSPMTREFIEDMLTRFKNNKRIHKDYVRSSMSPL